jgi:EmrB/QacA subfamily drug resistance transporter
LTHGKFTLALWEWHNDKFGFASWGVEVQEDGAIVHSRSFSQSLLAMLGLCFVLVMVALDQTVIGTALPTIVSELNGFDLYAWVGTSYLLTSVITVPIFGKLGDEHGRKPFVVAAIVLFTLASMLCGMAQNMLYLVLARALQGIGGGMLVATSFACVPDLFPETRERLRWQILFSGAFGLANAVGPSLGGYLAEYWGWRWVFFVNLPVGITSLGLVWHYLPRIRHTEFPPSRMDWLGALLIALALGCLQLLVEWLPQHKHAMSLTALGLASALSFVALIWWEGRCKNPVLPLSMFSHRILSSLFVLSAMMGFCMFAVMYYAPLMFQGGFGLSPNEAGLLVTPLAVFITVGSIINGRIVTRLHSPKLILYIGLSFFWVAALLLSRTSTATSHVLVALVMMAGGLGLGLLLPNLTLIIQATAPRTQLGVVTAMLQSMRMVGSMLGTALIGSLISRLYVSRVNEMLKSHQGSELAIWLRDPQILFSHAIAEKFTRVTVGSGHEAAFFLSGARAILVDTIHESQLFVAIFILVAFWLVYRIPSVTIGKSV